MLNFFNLFGYEYFIYLVTNISHEGIGGKKYFIEKIYNT